MLEIFTRNHTPYGRLQDNYCDWLEKNQILKWENDKWVYLSFPVTANVEKVDENGKRQSPKQSTCCYNSMLLDWTIKRMQEASEISESDVVRQIVDKNYDIHKNAEKFERHYHISKNVVQLLDM